MDFEKKLDEILSPENLQKAQEAYDAIPDTLTKESVQAILNCFSLVVVHMPQVMEEVALTLGNLRKAHPEFKKLWDEGGQAISEALLHTTMHLAMTRYAESQSGEMEDPDNPDLPENVKEMVKKARDMGAEVRLMKVPKKDSGTPNLDSGNDEPQTGMYL